MSVTLTLIPLPIRFLIAGMPSGVAGTLIITLGRSSARNSRRAALIVPLVSCARCGLTSSEAKPSAPSVLSKMGSSRSAAARMSSTASPSNRSCGSSASSGVGDERLVVVVAGRDRLLEDRRVRREARNPRVDQPLQLTSLDERAVHIVVPDRLTKSAQLLNRIKCL